MASRRGHAAAQATKAAVAKLTPLLRDFLHDPFEPHAICDWFVALAEHCPLWTLQERAYTPFVSHDIAKLVSDQAWQLMLAASHDNKVSNASYTGVISLGSKGPEVQRPPHMGGDMWGQLVGMYRETLLRRRDERPVPKSLHPQTLRVPPFKQEPADMGEDDDWPPELLEAVAIRDTLRELIAVRDLAKGKALRGAAQQRLDDFLQEIGAVARSGQPGIPRVDDFVRSLALECCVWLPVEAASRAEAPGRDASETLAWWGCVEEPASCAVQLALPFLHPVELRFVREREVGPERRLHSRLRERPLELTAVYLIHSRLRTLGHKLTAVADYGFHDQFVNTTPKQFLTENPLVHKQPSS